MTISGLAGKIKRFLARIPEDALILLVILLSATGSFGLGVLAGMDMREHSGNGLWIEERPVSGEAAALLGAQAAQKGIEVPVGEPIAPGGQYVGSKSGSRYYLPWCGGVKNIKPENLVYFASKEEAEAKGYTPAKNCKGL